MKKLSGIVLALTLIMALLMTSVSAGTVIYQNGAANANGDSEDETIRTAQYHSSDDAEGFLVYEMGPKILKDQVFDLSDADYVYVRFFVENVDNYTTGKGASLEISSAGKCDVEETAWNLDDIIYDCENGWNEMQFDLYASASAGADLSKINYVRWFWYSTGINTNIVDYVGFGGEDEDFSGIKTELGEIAKEEYVPEDIYSRFTKVDDVKAPVSGLAACQGTFDVTPVDVSKYTHAFVRVYIEGIENVTDGGQLEITSKMNDAQELTWNTSSLDLQNGWNELKLELAAPDADNGFEADHCKFFRLYIFNEGGILIDFDYIGFGNEGDSFSENLPAYLLKPASQEPAEEPETDAPAADPAVTDAPAADTPAADAPATTPSTPAATTADYGIVAALALIAVSGAAIVLGKKR